MSASVGDAAQVPTLKAWAVGFGGTILRRTTTGWTKEQAPVITTQDFIRVFSTDTANPEVFAVGRNGALLHLRGTVWSDESSGASLRRAVFGFGQNKIWAGGDQLRFYDGQTWADMASVPVNFGGLYGVAPDRVWGIQIDVPHAFYSYSAGTWTQQAAVPFSTMATASELWAASPTAVWVVGWEGLVALFNGTSWSQAMPTGSTQPFWNGVFGTSATNVYSAGLQGTAGMVMRWQSPLAVPTNMSPPAAPQLNDIHGTSASNLYVVGAGGKIFHYDGTAWATEQSGTTADLWGVWVVN